MDVDLDRFATAPADAATLAARRAALLDQLGYLADEARALAPLLARLPAWALTGTPLPGDRSVVETLADLAALDRAHHAAWLDALDRETGAPPALDPPPSAAGSVGEADLDALLGDLAAARQALVARFEALAPEAWGRAATLAEAPVTLYDLALRIVQHDADRLRDLAYRLHESALSDRPGDLPK